MSATRSFRCRPEAVTAARRFVRDVLSDRSRETVEAAELMTSELVTNCVRHARTDFELAIQPGEPIRVEVRDSGRGTPRVLSPSAREPAGRGLRIVQAMAEAWGVTPDSGGKAVWFTLASSGGASNPPSGSARGRPVGREGAVRQGGRARHSETKPAARRARPRGAAPAHRAGRALAVLRA